MENEPPKNDPVTEEHGVSKFISETASWAASIAYLGTLGTLCIGLPVAGAFTLGSFGLQAGGVLGMVGGGLAGIATGLAPVLIIEHNSPKENWGLLGATAVVATYTDRGVRAALAPVKFLSNIFAKSAAPQAPKNPDAAKKSEPKSKPPEPPQFKK